MGKFCARVPVISLCVLALATVHAFVFAQGPTVRLPSTVPDVNQSTKPAIAYVIPCEGMIDDGLFESIKRRTEVALANQASYLIYEISTYGGLVKSADDISKYLIHDASKKARTVAYVTTEAISAGAMISVSCNDIIMKTNTTIGDCAPIEMGGKLEGVEREKTESFIRAVFERASEVNNYPKPLLRAMVTQRIEVYRLKNQQTSQYEFFESDFLPGDANVYDLGSKTLIDSKEDLLTLTASRALEYGVARAVVPDRAAALEFLQKRDHVVFVRPPVVLATNWSEEMVRFLNSPTVTGILFMIGLLGLYIEFNTPGLGLPGLVAVICFSILFGSKFLIGLANWVEIAIFAVGIVLVLIEVLVIPGFGIPGILGIICILAGLFGMFIPNRPDEVPIPTTNYDYQLLMNGILTLGLGFIGFLMVLWLFAKHLPKIRFLGGLVMAPAPTAPGNEVISMTAPPENSVEIKVGDQGQVLGPLRPAGKASIGQAVVDVVSEGEFLPKGTAIKIVSITGNRVVVRKT